MNTTTQKNEWVKKHPYITAFIALLFLGFLLNIFGATDTPKKEVIAENKTEIKEEAKQPLSLEDKLKSLSVKIGSSDISYIQIEDQKADSNKGEDSRMITVSYKVNSFLSKDYLLKDTGKLSSKVFKEIFESNTNATDAVVWYYRDVTDKYGNTKNTLIMSQAIDKVTYQKINWPNFDSGKLCEFLRSESSTNGGETACAIMVDLK